MDKIKAMLVNVVLGPRAFLLDKREELSIFQN